MNNVVRAWKDASYRQSLSTEEQAMLPVNPAGEIELTDAELEAVFGADGGDGRPKNFEDNKQPVDQNSNTFGNGSGNGILNILNGANVDVDVLAAFVSKPITCNPTNVQTTPNKQW